MENGIWITPTEFMEFGAGYKFDSLTREIASRSTAEGFGSTLGLLPDPDPVLKKLSRRGEGVLKELLGDDHLTSVIQSRKLATLKRKWSFKAGTRDGKTADNPSKRLADALNEDIKNIDLLILVSQILDAPLYGLQPLELYWEPGGTWTRLKDIAPKPARWFGFNDRNEIRFLDRNNPWQGAEIPAGKFVFIKHFPEFDNPYGLRLLSRCFWPVTFKRGGVKFWAIFCEKFSIPFLFGQYPSGATQKQKDELMSNLERMVQDAVAIGVQGSSLQVVGHEGSGDGPHERLKAAMEAAMSKVIQGQILTTDVGAAPSHAVAKTQAETKEDIVEADQHLVKTAMEEIAWLYMLINDPSAMEPEFEWEKKPQALTEFSERDVNLKQTGVDFKKTYYMRRYELKEDEFEINQGTGGRDQGAATAQFAEGNPRLPDPGQQAIDALADKTIEMAKNVFNKNEAAILKTVMDANGYEDAMERLLNMYPDMEVKEAEDMLARGMFAAEMAGRLAAG